MGDNVGQANPEKVILDGSNTSHNGQDPIDKGTEKHESDDLTSGSDAERGINRQAFAEDEQHAIEEDGSEDTDNEATPSILDRVASRVTSRSSIDPGPPPDGGWTAWSQCIAGHFVISNSWGWINSFGVWQDYLPTVLPDSSSLAISFIGSMAVFLLFFLGTFTGRLTDAGLFRPVFLTGSLLQLVGIFCTSLCSKYWQFMLAQGFCIGLGNGCLFCPALALVSTYFYKKRALALGVTACGSVTGGLIFPVMARQLLPKIGFGWTVRAIGMVQLVSLLIANVLAKPRIKPRTQGPLIELKAFKEMEYTFFALGAFCFFWGIYVPFYYLPAYSRTALNPPFSFETSLNLLLIMNGAGLPGRLIPSYLADRAGAVNVLIPICGVTSLLVFCWMAVDSPGSLYAWTVLYGNSAAGIQAMFPAALAFLTSDIRKLGVRMGMVFSVVSIAVLTGPPIGGAIIDKTGGYKGTQAFGGSVLAIAFVFLISSKIVRMRRLGMGWTGKV